jgi:hypothetical protein
LWSSEQMTGIFCIYYLFSGTVTEKEEEVGGNSQYSFVKSTNKNGGTSIELTGDIGQLLAEHLGIPTGKAPLRNTDLPKIAL